MNSVLFSVRFPQTRMPYTTRLSCTGVRTCTVSRLPSCYAVLSSCSRISPPLSRDRSAIAASSVLVYPLHGFAPAAARAVGWPSTTSLFEALAAALPSLLAWSVAVWGGGQLRWGLASGLSVGLLTACLSLKSASFAQVCVPFKAAAGVDRQQSNLAIAGGQQSKLAAAAAPRKEERENSGDGDGDGDEHGAVSGDATFAKATGAVTSFDVNLDNSSSSKNDAKHDDNEGRGAHEGGSSPIDTPIRATTPASSAASSAQETQVTFGEFLFFLLAAPSLVYEPRFLKVSARRPPCVARAASEFFHAGLTFLALHAACSTLVAPTFRVLATASAQYFQGFSSASCDAGGAAGLGESDWVDVAGWAGLKAGGSGGWLHDFVPGGDEPALGGGDMCGFSRTMSAGWVGVAVALAWGLFVFSPLVHFGTFYGFWHCVCLGCAELWGYPDRDLYGEIHEEALWNVSRAFHPKIFCFRW